jgi:hypothetical protein
MKKFLWVDVNEWQNLRTEIRMIHRLLLDMGRDTADRSARTEQQLDDLVRAEQETEKALMATKATDQALIAEVHRNTDVTAAANTALSAQTAAITDLTQKLADAIAGSDAADDPEVQAALAELKANNDAQVAATPVTAAAIANTDASAPVPKLPA